ncbi:response regulator [Deinococcus yavapaiensis]|uniref:Response regulator receiver domain-containing protein n=1 Tax=Deinococcus yavapaiensis KR-236 TaxID=694435 RepID=A0A318SDC8_9DEIO|nr:response regulator [Deinococcus yavapaiensis]PYE56643.1 response regulator receiver domain-containing protein [Deinococcus yavapaiensis KR-236]
MSNNARRARLAEHLRLVGVDVREAQSALEALTQLERTVPDAIVCDAQLQDMTGMEMLDIVRSEPQYSSLVFLLVGSEELSSFGLRDLAVSADATPSDILRELRLILDFNPLGVQEVSGSFETLGWMGVLRALNQGRRSGELRVTVESSDSRVWLQSGQIVHARYGLLQGEAAITALHGGLMNLVNADYTFTAGTPAVPRSITTPTPVLLGRAAPSDVLRLPVD